MIPVYQPHLSGRERDYVLQCLDSGWISSRGEFIGKFESAFADYIGAPHATSVCNGTVALHLAMAALGIKAGDEVIVPTFTYIASVNTILQTGATPVYVDFVAEGWNMDVADVRAKITSRTRAVMAVHLYGLPCDMEALAELCREKNIYLIEDCAEAFGAYCNGRHVGTFGDAATFSFFGNKTITTGEGGMVVMRDPAMHAKAASLKTQGVSATREYWHDRLAYNYRMTNIEAVIGLAQIEQAADILAKKKQVAGWYRAVLQGSPIDFQPELPGMVHSHWMIAATVASPELLRGLRAHLKENGVETRPLFPPAHTMPHTAAAGDFPVAVDISARGLNLPSYPALAQDQVERIAALIAAYLSQARAASAALKSYAAQIWASRHFWVNLAMSDLRARWRRSFFGIFWSMLQPLGMTALLSVVLSRLFHSDITSYAPYILSGVIVWEFIVFTCTGGAQSFVQADAYIKQYSQPLAIYTLRTVLTALFVLMLASVPLIGWTLVVMPQNFGFSWLALLLFYPLLALVGWPLATLLAYTGARFRDLPHALALILQALWFLSPVYFEPKMFRNGDMGWLVDDNPVYHILQLIRAPLLTGAWPDFYDYLFIIATVVVLGLAAIVVGRRVEKKIVFYL